MKRFLFVLFFWAGIVNAQPVIEHQIYDDGFVEVPLQFVFPYYGQLFTNSWMFDNGVVGFYSPFNGYWGGQQYFSQPFSANMGGQFSYMIAPLWTDLINYSGTFTTQGDSTFQKYSWNNISQWGYPDNLNSFSLEITPSGSINVQYDQINISGYPVSVGTTGDLSQGEFEQIFYANSSEPVSTNSIPNWNTYTEVNACGMDPLSSPECPGYEVAYYEQQCSFDPLYDSQCPGYEIAYFDQQCSIDPLYNNQCPGYEVAYFDQQCSLDPLYDGQCPGYEIAYFDQQCSLDPLYNNQCPGYEIAYFDQQCSANALYDSQCPGYEVAYFDQQCSLDPLYDGQCPGYEIAYFDQQCSLDPLYNNQCPGYEIAYFDQQCSLDPLYNNQCPGYEIAYFDQQCSIDPLYNNQCPGYEVAYFLSQQGNMVSNNAQEEIVFDEVAVIADVETETEKEPEPELESTVPDVLVETASLDESLESQDEVTSDSKTETAATNLTSLVMSIIQSDDSPVQQTSTSTNTSNILENTESATTASVTDLSNDQNSMEIADAPADDQTTDPIQETTQALIALSDSDADTLNEVFQLTLAESNDTTDTEAPSNAEQVLTAVVMAVTNNTTTVGAETIINDVSGNLDNSTDTDVDVALTDSTQESTESNVLEISFESLFATSTATVSQAISQAADVELNQTTVSTETLTDNDQEYLSELETVVQESVNTNLSSTSVAFENSTMQQVLAMGGTITQILNTPVPDFSRFDIKPPSQEEQIVASRIENSLGNMSEEDIESQAESRIGSMDPAAQAIALQLIGYKPGFDQYGGNLVDQSNWYTDRSVYTNNQVPAAARSNLMFGAQDQRHQELMSLQNRR